VTAAPRSGGGGRRCRSCGQQIRFLRTESGRWIPVERSELNGNILVERGIARVIGGAELSQARDDGRPLFVSHFTTCPNAPAHRRRREKPLRERAPRPPQWRKPRFEQETLPIGNPEERSLS
jgi:hypothetical protein